MSGRALEYEAEDIKILPKKDWEGTVIPMRYTTEEYYDLQIERDSAGFNVRLKKQRFDKPVTHYPEEYDFPDKLYLPHWEKACVWGNRTPSDDRGEGAGGQGASQGCDSGNPVL